MVAVTYGTGRVTAPKVAAAKTGTKSRGIFARVIDAIAYSQMKRAEHEIARYRHLLPQDYKLYSVRYDNLPFGGL